MIRLPVSTNDPKLPVVSLGTGMTYIEPVRARKEQAATPIQQEQPQAREAGSGRPIPTDVVSISAKAGLDRPNEEDKGNRLDAALDGRPLRPSDIALCLSLGRVDAAVQVAARLAGVPTTAAINAYQNGDVGKALSQLASIGVDGGTAGWLLRGMGRTVPASPNDMARAQAASSAYVSTSRSVPQPKANDDQEPEEDYEPLDIRI